MNIVIRKFRRRLKDLEDYLGLIYDTEDYPEHQEKEDAKMRKLDKRIAFIENKLIEAKIIKIAKDEDDSRWRKLK